MHTVLSHQRSNASIASHRIPFPPVVVLLYSATRKEQTLSSAQVNTSSSNCTVLIEVNTTLCRSDVTLQFIARPRKGCVLRLHLRLWLIEFHICVHFHVFIHVCSFHNRFHFHIHTAICLESVNNSPIYSNPPINPSIHFHPLPSSNPTQFPTS